VDPTHPMLVDDLTKGYDFTRDLEGGSEWPDLDQSTVSILDQSTVSILDQSTVSILDQSTVSILDQSTVSILDQSTVSILDGLAVPASFGHGTMVAGLVHLLAPQARIMPLKAFTAAGESRISDIVEAIYYAVDNGAKVINMSFSMDTSRQISRAVDYAAGHGVICVGSAGNDGIETVVYPAGLRRVVGVAATNDLDQRASFSNFGQRLVTVAAPGEDLVTVFPGGHYALVSGTSFSAALTSGAAAVLASVDRDLRTWSAFEAFEASQFIGQELGFGRIDLPAAVTRLQALDGSNW
jgi:subtilisin family serine protease